jgi:hypothetical protein
MFRKLAFGSVVGVVPCVRDSNDETTVVQAITQRIAVDLPAVDPGVLLRFQAFVCGFINHHLSPLTTLELQTFDEWLANAPYPQSRKDELRRCYDELHGHLPSKKQASTVKCFIKTESYPVGEFIKPGRSIMSRSDWAKVAMGPAFASIERKVYDLKKPDGHPYFIKHVPVALRHVEINSIRSAGSRYLITDYTAFESSFSASVMKACECQMYEYMLRQFPELASFITRTLTGDNILKFPGGTKARIKARRMSGDMCTSLGNGFTNLMLMLFFASENGLDVNGFVEGDDGIFAVQGNIPADFGLMFSTLGFVIKMAEFPDPALGGFCGIIAADSGNIRDPVRFLQTFGWTSSCIDGGPQVMAQLLRAKAMSAVFESPQCPLVRPLAERALELTSGVTPRFALDGYHALPVLDVPEYSPSLATRDLFASLFGISVEAQLEIETRLKTCESADFIAPYLTLHPNLDFVGSRFVGP